MPRLFLFIPCLAMLAGCGGADYEPQLTEGARSIKMSSGNSANLSMSTIVGDENTDAPASLQRKIVYTADVEVVVENYAQAAEQVEALVQRFNGRIASSNESGTSGQPRS